MPWNSTLRDANGVIKDARTSADPLSLPLYDTSKIEYLGRFLLPSDDEDITGLTGFTGNFTGMDQGGGAIGFNPNGNGGAGSLFVGGRPPSDGSPSRNKTIIAEFTIPTPLLSGPYNTASVLQSGNYYAADGSTSIQQAVKDGETGNGCPLTGILVYNSRLIFTAAGLYTNSHQYGCYARTSLDLSASNVIGPYNFSSLSNGRIIGCGMGCALPSNWQSVFGGNKAIIGGGGNLSTLPSTNYGVGFHFFDPDDVGNTGTTIPTVTANWTQIDSGPYSFQDNASADWNGMSTHRGTIVLPESRTFIGYGNGGVKAQYFNPPTPPQADYGQGMYGVEGASKDRFFLFDAQDLKDGYDGTVSNRDTIEPYGVFDMDFCDSNQASAGGNFQNEVEQIKGLTWDAENRRAYVIEQGGKVHVLSFPE